MIANRYTLSSDSTNRHWHFVMVGFICCDMCQVVHNPRMQLLVVAGGTSLDPVNRIVPRGTSRGMGWVKMEGCPPAFLRLEWTGIIVFARLLSM